MSANKFASQQDMQNHQQPYDRGVNSLKPNYAYTSGAQENKIRPGNGRFGYG